MASNKIIQFCLETRAKELKESGKSLDDIALILSEDSKQKITKSSVFRYFESNKLIASQVIEKQDKLKVAVAQAEISTIEQRQQVISGLLGLAENAQNEHTRVIAFKEANNALDSLDKRLGSSGLTEGSQTIINITQNNLSLKDKIQRYRDAGLFNDQ